MLEIAMQVYPPKLHNNCKFQELISRNILFYLVIWNKISNFAAKIRCYTQYDTRNKNKELPLL